MKRIVGIIGMVAIAVLLMGGAFTAQWTAKQVIPEKVYRPEKEEVRVTPAGYRAAQDPCIPNSPFDLPTARPQAC
jgi:hypothetical protein